MRAIERFHIYLHGLEFTIITDCNALVHAVTKTNLNPRIARWTLILQNYKFKMAHRPGKNMGHVDALSRMVAHVSNLILERELELRQLQDAQIERIANELEFDDHDKFRLIDGLVFRKGIDRDRFVVPESMIKSVLKIHHDNMAHCDLDKTYKGLYASYWFPSMRKRVRDYIDNCVTCLIMNSDSHGREGELQITTTPTKPFEIIHANHFGPLPQSSDGSKYTLVVVDAFTRFTWFLATRTTTTKETCNSLRFLFNVFGIPKEIVTDRGTAFTSHEFSDFTEAYSLHHRKAAVASS